MYKKLTKHPNFNRTRNTLACDQSNYSSRIVFFHIPIEFGQTGISAIQSADPENPTLEPKKVNRTICRGDIAIWIFPKYEVGRRPVAGRTVLNIYFFLSLILYTPLRYVRNVAHEE